jgi:hypothetical protein
MYHKIRPFLMAAILIGITLVTMVGMLITGSIVGSYHGEIAIGFIILGMITLVVTVLVLK